MGDWKNVRVRECVSERVTFEHRHENKSCSACQECQVLQVPSFCLTLRHFLAGNQLYVTGSIVVIKKCLNVRQKLGTRSLSHTLTLTLSHSRHTEQLLFPCLCSKVTLSLSHSLTLTLFQSLIHSLSTCWTSFVFISMLKTQCLLLKIAMLFSWEPALWHLN